MAPLKTNADGRRPRPGWGQRGYQGKLAYPWQFRASILLKFDGSGKTQYPRKFGTPVAAPHPNGGCYLPRLCSVARPRRHDYCPVLSRLLQNRERLAPQNLRRLPGEGSKDPRCQHHQVVDRHLPILCPMMLHIMSRGPAVVNLKPLEISGNGLQHGRNMISGYTAAAMCAMRWKSRRE